MYRGEDTCYLGDGCSVQTGCHPAGCWEFEEAPRCNEASWCQWADGWTAGTVTYEATCDVRYSDNDPVQAYYNNPCLGNNQQTCGKVGGCRWGRGCEGTLVDCTSLDTKAACYSAPSCVWDPVEHW